MRFAPHGRRQLPTRFGRVVLVVIVIYASWLGMMAIHEAGHVMHALVAGGQEIEVKFPVLGFSQTIVRPNPRPLLVAWGGPIWGVGSPLLICAILWTARARIPHVVRFFTGLCLIANGGYLGVAWMMSAGDAADLVALGTPRSVLIGFGLVCVPTGLLFWHRTRGVAGVVRLKRRRE